MEIDPIKFLQHCFRHAVDAAAPYKVLKDYIPGNKENKIYIVGAGKAAARMAAAFENNWKGDIAGIVIVPYGYGVPCSHIQVIEASHPIPDENSVKAAKTIKAFIENADRVSDFHVLLSGGGSSLMCLPAAGISLDQKQSINQSLLHSGASINEINCVRKHLSSLKGGRLADLMKPANVYTYAISDVVGDDPSVIASGPTVADETTSEQAIEILSSYSIDVPATVKNWLESPASESIKTINSGNEYTIISSAKMMLENIGVFCYRSGINFINLGEVTGNARDVGKEHSLIAKHMTISEPTLFYSGGETTVEVTGKGKGGRNTEYLLSLAISLDSHPNIFALAADTDGIDGSENNAGAIITPDTLTRMKKENINPVKMLNENDSYSAFAAVDSLVVTGPTGTNVNDFRAILILPE